MDLKCYAYEADNDFQNYEFNSEGPRGRIKKSVRCTKMQEGCPAIFNLDFGDVSDHTNGIDDLAVSDNSDTIVVLATVASIVNDFFIHHGNHYIFARGSTNHYQL